MELIKITLFGVFALANVGRRSANNHTVCVPLRNVMSYRNGAIARLARQPKVAEVACYHLERTLVGCADPPLLRRSALPISVLELTKKRSD